MEECGMGDIIEHSKRGGKNSLNFDFSLNFYGQISLALAHIDTILQSYIFGKYKFQHFLILYKYLKPKTYM